MKRFRDRIRSINPLSSLRDAQIDEVLESGEFMQGDKGDVVFAKGEDDQFAYYLMEGELFLSGEREGVVGVNSRRAGYAIGNLHPRPFDCVVHSMSAVVLRLGCERVEEWVARAQLVASELHGVDVADLSESPQLDGAWMFQMLQSEIFKVLPTENIERFFMAVERREVAAGDVVIQEGSRGDYYYMIEDGRCEITREADGRMALLGPGGTFGEEALISEEPRNASAIMLTDGVLMRLGKSEFRELLARPVIHSISAADATRELESGRAVLVDVRTEGEHRSNSLVDSLNLPLDNLRVRTTELDPSKTHITFCDMEARSLSAAFLLRERGFKAAYLKGGMSSLKNLEV